MQGSLASGTGNLTDGGMRCSCDPATRLLSYYLRGRFAIFARYAVAVASTVYLYLLSYYIPIPEIPFPVDISSNFGFERSQEAHTFTRQTPHTLSKMTTV